MKQSPELETIQQKMMPGTANGFLGEDTRKLADIISEDDSIIRTLGITHKEIAARMEYFSEAAAAGLGNELIVDDIYLVSSDDHRGTMPCPFGDNHKAMKRNTKLQNLRTGKTASWSDLNIHMIAEHGFYEGAGSVFRIEAKEIPYILGILE